MDRVARFSIATEAALGSPRPSRLFLDRAAPHWDIPHVCETGGLLGDESTVDHQFGTGDEGGLVGGEEEDAVGDVDQLSDAT